MKREPVGAAPIARHRASPKSSPTPQHRSPLVTRAAGWAGSGRHGCRWRRHGRTRRRACRRCGRSCCRTATCSLFTMPSSSSTSCCPASSARLHTRRRDALRTREESLMHDDHLVAEGRIARALRERIRPALYSASTPLELRAWHVQGEPVAVGQALAATYEPFAVGDAWGTPWSTTWFAVSGEVPAAWAGARVEGVADLGFAGQFPGFQAEALVFDRQGVPLKGLAPRNTHVPVAAPARGGEPVDLLVGAAAKPTVLGATTDEWGAFFDFRPNRLGDGPAPAGPPLYQLRRMDLAVLDENVFALVHDIEVLQQLMEQLPLTEPRRHEVLRALSRALDVLDLKGVAAGAGDAREE